MPVLFQASYSILFVRGSLGFGEEALQSLPGKAGSQVLIVHSVKKRYLLFTCFQK